MPSSSSVLEYSQEALKRSPQLGHLTPWSLPIDLVLTLQSVQSGRFLSLGTAFDIINFNFRALLSTLEHF